MDVLATYGKQAIDPITEIINSVGVDNQVNEHGLQVIEDISKKIQLIEVTLIRKVIVILLLAANFSIAISKGHKK
jgi:hypothetical protein